MHPTKLEWRGRLGHAAAATVIFAWVSACGSETGPRGFDPTNGAEATNPAGDSKHPADPNGHATFDKTPSAGDDGGARTGDGGASCAADALDTANCPCTSGGLVRQCYTGPSATRGAGICRDGTQTCQPRNELGGAWSPCTGAVVPAAEDCSAATDRNCDGKIGCADPTCAASPACLPACTAGDTLPCYTGPSGTLGKGTCNGGVYTCESGKWSTTCAGQVLPTTEICGDGLDNDCNDLADCKDPVCTALPACCTAVPSTVDATIYANSPDALYRIHPTTFAVTKVGDFNFNPPDQMTDVAVTPSNQVYGVSYTTLYSIDRATGAATAMVSLGGSANNGLTFLPSGLLLAADSGGDVKTVNTTTGVVTLIGNYGSGRGSSGDLIAIGSGEMYATATGESSDSLVRVNTTNGASTLVGSTKETGVWGLAYAGARVIGFMNDGHILTINPATGASTVLASTGISFWGAGQSPLVVENGCP